KAGYATTLGEASRGRRGLRGSEERNWRSSDCEACAKSFSSRARWAAPGIAAERNTAGDAGRWVASAPVMKIRPPRFVKAASCARSASESSETCGKISAGPVKEARVRGVTT